MSNENNGKIKNWLILHINQFHKLKLIDKCRQTFDIDEQSVTCILTDLCNKTTNDLKKEELFVKINLGIYLLDELVIKEDKFLKELCVTTGEWKHFIEENDFSEYIFSAKKLKYIGTPKVIAKLKQSVDIESVI